MRVSRWSATAILVAIVLVGLIVPIAYCPGVYHRVGATFSHVGEIELWQSIKDFCNSAFFVAIVGSLAGAFAGAYGGYKIVEKGRNRDELLKEIRNTNAAAMVAFGICNSLLSTKQQLVKPLKDRYDAQKAGFSEHVRGKTTGEIGPDVGLEFQADFQLLTLPPLGIDILQNQVFEKLSLVGRPLLLVTTLRQSIHSLEHALNMRNSLIESYKAHSVMPPNLLIHLYFGLPYGDGHVNRDYPSALEAIYELTDSSIFFSHRLCKDLGEHGDRIAAEFKRKFGSGAPTIGKPDFSKAEAANLMPAPESFADWDAMFVKKTS